MAKNAPGGDGRRIGAVKDRAQFHTRMGIGSSRDAYTGQFLDVKRDGEKFKGVRRET